ncbi:YhdH/YhfP family quinone oxidoreductase [SAR86 cluster bacterium]|nr:YhdH/YhfP family quinone oxidoreductase [SAR86 cluster bacterium]
MFNTSFMEDIKYKAFFTQETESGFSNSIESLSIADLEENDLLVKVSYSSLNYKDALSASGNKGVTRTYPHTPGIDAVGEVVKSNSSDFKDGDKIIVTGYDLGMNTYGGFGQYISIPATWAISLPNELSEAEAMSIGTAGLTAGLCVRKLLQNDLTPDSGDVLVTGASGGVGSVAVMVLSKLGFNVVALTGKQDQVDYLESLGASSVIIRSQMEEQGKPLQKGIYQGGVDTVGGNILSNFISQTSQRGAITCCGNVASDKLETSIFPFILRGVTLIGIDSAESLLEVKKEIWNNFSNDWKIDLEKITKEVFLESLSDEVEKILKGNQVGRIRVNLG